MCVCSVRELTHCWRAIVLVTSQSTGDVLSRVTASFIDGRWRLCELSVVHEPDVGRTICWAAAALTLQLDLCVRRSDQLNLQSWKPNQGEAAARSQAGEDGSELKPLCCCWPVPVTVTPVPGKTLVQAKSGVWNLNWYSAESLSVRFLILRVELPLYRET